jgi:hypothetical protein
VLAQPVGEAALEARAGVAELGQLDEVLELQVVDVVDQPSLLMSCPGRDSNPQALAGNGF